MAVGVAACSAESSRFNDNPYAPRGNPEATGSIPPAQAAPAGRVESRPLPPQTAQAAPPCADDAPDAVRAASPAAAGGWRRTARRRLSSPPARARRSDAARTSPTSPDRSRRRSPRRRQLELGRRHRHHRRAGRHHREHRAPLRRAGLRDHPGQQPHRAGDHPSRPATGHSALQQLADSRRRPRRPRHAAPLRSGKPRQVAAASPAGNPGVHVVAPGETLSRISRLYGKPVSEIAKANNIQPTPRSRSATAW